MIDTTVPQYRYVCVRYSILFYCVLVYSNNREKEFGMSHSQFSRWSHHDELHVDQRRPQVSLLEAIEESNGGAQALLYKQNLMDSNPPVKGSRDGS